MELLSPAGNLNAAYAAFNAGADAIYIGGKSFSARASATNFTNDEIKEIVFFAHQIKRKVYVTINTLLFQDEFFEAVEFAEFLYSINIDGIIIQDLGFASYLHKVLPDLPLNASTQLNCHNIRQAKALIKLGFNRLVLAREADIEFIKQVKALGVEVEVFGHGALCVSYSGNCLLSSFIGDRSGNRGRCAQPCRMKYDLLENNKVIKQGTYLISTKDLMTLDNIKDLLDAGVDSLKLEGRLKSDEYVYLISKAYRLAIDDYSNKKQIEKSKTELTKVFSRGFTKGYIFNESPFKVINNDSNNHQGEVIGKVISTNKNRISIKLTKPLSRLDGIRFNNKEQVGLLVEKMFLNKEPVELAKPGQIIELSGIEDANKFLNAEVIKTKDYLLNKEIELALKSNIKAPINGKFKAHINKPLELEINFDGTIIKVNGPKVEAAINNGTSKERIIEQLNKTNEYPYYFKDIICDIEKVFIPISILNKLRNDALNALKEKLSVTNIVEKKEYINTDYKLEPSYGYKAISENIIQEDEATLLGLPTYSYNDDSYRNELRVNNNEKFDKENELMHFVIENEENVNLVASMYTNITNSYALDAYYDLGFKECILSLELDYNSMKALINDYRNRHNTYPNVSTLIYGKVDYMIMKSCPIGTLFNNTKLHCQRCHNMTYELNDRVGVKYHLLGDSDCNMRVLSDKAICYFHKLDELEDIGINTGYLLFTDENKEKVNEVINSLYDRKLPPHFKTSNGHINNRPL